MSVIKPFSLLCLVLAALLFSSARLLQAADTPPDDMVRSGITVLADAAAANAAVSGENEQALTEAVRLFLSQYTDVDYAARLILARHWSTATPDQRDRFVESFGSQVTKRLVVLVTEIDFESVSVEPYSGDIEETPLLVQATFQNSDGQTFKFGLVIHEKDGRWSVFDVIAEGVSYVKTYRNQLGGEIADIGLEPMLNRFELRDAALSQQPQGELRPEGDDQNRDQHDKEERNR